MAAKKKPAGSKPFAGQTGRKPSGEMGTGKSKVVNRFPLDSSSKSVQTTKTKAGKTTVSVRELKKKKK